MPTDESRVSFSDVEFYALLRGFGVWFSFTHQLSFCLAAENPRSAHTESCDHPVTAMCLLRLLPREKGSGRRCPLTVQVLTVRVTITLLSL